MQLQSIAVVFVNCFVATVAVAVALAIATVSVEMVERLTLPLSAFLLRSIVSSKGPCLYDRNSNIHPERQRRQVGVRGGCSLRCLHCMV